jgi:hypothetical protein
VFTKGGETRNNSISHFRLVTLQFNHCSHKFRGWKPPIFVIVYGLENLSEIKEVIANFPSNEEAIGKSFGQNEVWKHHECL